MNGPVEVIALRRGYYGSLRGPEGVCRVVSGSRRQLDDSGCPAG